jgi:8-oxo-dGTP diphosphatase
MSQIEVIARGLCMRGSKVLLCQNLKSGYFYLPGGHVEFEEAACDALARELVEEAAVKVRVGKCVLATEGVFPTRKRVHHEINLVFHMELDEDVEVQSVETQIAFEWVELAAIVDCDLRPAAIKGWIMSARDQSPVEWISEIRKED